jgi:penicillin-binding protein 1C
MKALTGRQPPPFEGQKSGLPLAPVGSGPVIKSPREGLGYAIPLMAKESEKKIILQASADAGTGSLYWFVDSVFIGRGKPGEMLAWQPVPGIHQVVVADDQGRTATRKIIVELAQ